MVFLTLIQAYAQEQVHVLHQTIALARVATVVQHAAQFNATAKQLQTQQCALHMVPVLVQTLVHAKQDTMAKIARYTTVIVNSSTPHHNVVVTVHALHQTHVPVLLATLV
jgi:anaerobic ribonucleoside-triphosphate reductase